MHGVKASRATRDQARRKCLRRALLRCSMRSEAINGERGEPQFPRGKRMTASGGRGSERRSQRGDLAFGLCSLWSACGNQIRGAFFFGCRVLTVAVAWFIGRRD